MNARTMKNWIRTALVVLLTGFACDQQSADQPAASDQTPERPQTTTAANRPSDVAGLVEDIANGVGEVQQSIPQGTKGPVVVFEEYHTSRVGQLQIGVMLLRMYERHGLRLIGLEGALQRPQPLDATWFHKAGGASSQQFREDTAVRMLAEGEISAAEFIAMLFSQVQVRGLEVEEEYSVRPYSKGNAVTLYLLKIAEKKLTQSDIRKINALITEKKEKEAFDCIKNADPWVLRQFELLDQKNISIPELAQQVRDIQNEARKLGVQVEPEVREGLQKTQRFYETAMRRSDTMTSYLVNLLGSSRATPVAMVIGAGHSKEVVDKLRSQNVSCALVRPIALNPEFANLSMEEFERKNDLEWARIANGTLGRLLNSHRRPPSVIETPTAQSYASAYMAVMVVSEAVRSGKRVPEDVQIQLAGLPQLRIDFGSFEHDGYDVIFRMWLTGTDGREKEVWARAGTADSREQAGSLEEKLLLAIADLGGGGRMTPREAPPSSERTRDKEGPGDGKRGGVIISRVGMRSLVVFAESKQRVTAVGRISG